MLPNFMRIFLLLTEIAVNVLRTFLQNEYQPEDLETFIENNKTLIYHLHHIRRDGCCMCSKFPKQQIIRNMQFNMLFVRNGKKCKKCAKNCHCEFMANPNIELKDIDLTLIITLLNNCLTLDLRQNQYLTVIRNNRNEISHSTLENDYDDCQFSTMWGNISNATDYLAKCISEEYSKEILDKIRQLKKRTLSPVEYTNAILEILLWKRDHDENTSKILNKLQEMQSQTVSRDIRMECMLKRILTHSNATESQQSTQNRDTTDIIALEETECTTGILDVTICPVEANIIHGNKQIILYTRTPSLTVTSFQTADADSNVCCSSNAVGTSSCNTSAVLKYRSVPKVQMLKNYYMKPYGDKVVIQCRIESDSCVTDVYWERFSNNSIKKIKNGDIGYHGSTTTSPSLTIDYVTKDDAGSYICHAINEAGIGTSKSATLRLNGEYIKLFENKCFTSGATVVLDASNTMPSTMGLPHISVSPTEATIIHGNNQTIHCTVTGIPSATSIEWFFTPKGGSQYQLNIGGWDQKYVGGSTHQPSLTVTNFQLSDAGSYVCRASNDFGTASCNPPSVLNFGWNEGNYDETYKVIDGMRLVGKKCRKTALSYSVLVYTALRGSLSLEQDYSNILREIAKAIKAKEDSFILNRKFLEMKLVPHFLKRTENLTYEPKDQVVKKSIINSFGKECKECLLKICSFDIIDQVRHEENAYTMANAFVDRMKFDRRDAFHIGEYIETLGEEIDGNTLEFFVDILQQCKDITFDHIDLLLDGLTKKGTDFEVFRKLPTLYDTFYRKVDIYQNTIFHHIVAIYSVNEKYKLYMQHFCENKFDMLQIRNMEKHTAIDFASYLGRTEVIAIVVYSIKTDRQSILDGILQMATSGVNTLQMQNNKRLINISLPNISYGKRADYTNIFQSIGKEPDITSNDDNKEDGGCSVSSAYYNEEDDVCMEREIFVDPIHELLSLLLPTELIEILRCVNNLR